MKNTPLLPVLVVGGGAAGFFAAITCAETNSHQPVILLEQGHSVLSKVKISGGGRCNVTHACFNPKELIGFYPRGGKELLGPFHHFQPRDTVAWFTARGVPIKTEPDGRMFPISDSSQSIIDALVNAAEKTGVSVRSNISVSELTHESTGRFRATLSNGETLECSKILLATGSGRSGFEWAKKFGHTIELPVPSLFTFHVSDERIKGLEGISVPKAEVRVKGTKLRQTGPLLITHTGLSGPAILKLSAWGARIFHDLDYQAEISIDWISWKPQSIEKGLRDIKGEYAKKFVEGTPAFGTPRRLWEKLTAYAKIPSTQRWTDLTRDQMDRITRELIEGSYTVRGKSPFKEEFVTCGGVRLKEVNFKTMESFRCPGLYFAGEILDVDAVTGGFNFQNAWTTGWLAGRALAASSAG